MDARNVVNDYSPRQLLGFARDPRTPSDVLTVIGLSAFDPLTRFEAARNERMPPAALEVMARDVGWVCEGVAQNRSTPVGVLARLADQNWKLAGFVAANLGAPPWLLDSLYASSVEHVRVRVAGNPNASLSLLRAIVADPGSGRAGVEALKNLRGRSSAVVSPVGPEREDAARRRISHAGLADPREHGPGLRVPPVTGLTS